MESSPKEPQTNLSIFQVWGPPLHRGIPKDAVYTTDAVVGTKLCYTSLPDV